MIDVPDRARDAIVDVDVDVQLLFVLSDTAQEQSFFSAHTLYLSITN